MTDDELKLMFDTLRQDMRHQVEVTIEHVDQRFDLLAESIATLDEKLDRKSSELEERMESLAPSKVLSAKAREFKACVR